MEISKMTLTQLGEFIAESRKEASELATRGADLNGEDADRFDALDKDIREATERKTQIERRAADVFAGVSGGTIRTEDGTPPARIGGTTTRDRDSAPKSLRGALTLGKGDSFRRWADDNGQADPNHRDISFDRMVRGMVNGDWRGSEAERALVEANSSAGGVLVPTPVATNLIDLARAQAAVLQAGATVVPMASKTLRVPRLTGEGSPQFYSEGQQRVAQDISFDAVTLDAKAFDRLILVSKELFDDSNPNVGNVIADAFAKQMALGIDRFALFGDGVAPNPLGLVNTPAVPKVAHGANGTALTNYDWALQAIGNVRGQSFNPTAQIANPRTATSLSLLKDSTGAYLAAPAGLPAQFVTASVPANLTTGTNSDTSVLVTGQFDQLLIGLRQDFRLRVLSERWADTNQIGFLAQMRWDVVVAQPNAFQVDTGIRA